MADSPESYSRLRDAQRTGRQLLIEGALWIVYELPASPFDRRQAVSLVFESESAIRRVRNFPSEWRALGDTALFALSWAV